MKFVVTFFLYLCFHLVGGSKVAHATAHSYNHFLGHSIGKVQKAESLTSGHGLIITQGSDSTEDNDQLISDEDEEEGHESLIKKHLLQAKYLLAFSYVFILQYESSLQADRLPFYGHFSCSSTPKYIVQRVLRV